MESACAADIWHSFVNLAHLNENADAWWKVLRYDVNQLIIQRVLSGWSAGGWPGAITKSSGKTWLIRSGRWKGSRRLCLMWINGFYQSSLLLNETLRLLFACVLWMAFVDGWCAGEGDGGWWHLTSKLDDLTSIIRHRLPVQRFVWSDAMRTLAFVWNPRAEEEYICSKSEFSLRRKTATMSCSNSSAVD